MISTLVRNTLILLGLFSWKLRISVDGNYWFSAVGGTGPQDQGESIETPEASPLTPHHSRERTRESHHKRAQ
jgi:hypothetical protein